jgi:hypothetical protein
VIFDRNSIDVSWPWIFKLELKFEWRSYEDRTFDPATPLQLIKSPPRQPTIETPKQQKDISQPNEKIDGHQPTDYRQQDCGYQPETAGPRQV